MKYAIDKIEDDVVVLEEIETGQIKEEMRKNLPTDIHEGSILLYSDSFYKVLEETEKKRRADFRSRLERLKNKKCDD